MKEQFKQKSAEAAEEAAELHKSLLRDQREERFMYRFVTLEQWV